MSKVVSLTVQGSMVRGVRTSDAASKTAGTNPDIFGQAWTGAMEDAYRRVDALTSDEQAIVTAALGADSATREQLERSFGHCAGGWTETAMGMTTDAKARDGSRWLYNLRNQSRNELEKWQANIDADNAKRRA
jgi:hypothetical protein